MCFHYCSEIPYTQEPLNREDPDRPLLTLPAALSDNNVVKAKAYLDMSMYALIGYQSYGKTSTRRFHDDISFKNRSWHCTDI